MNAQVCEMSQLIKSDLDFQARTSRSVITGLTGSFRIREIRLADCAANCARSQRKSASRTETRLARFQTERFEKLTNLHPVNFLAITLSHRSRSRQLSVLLKNGLVALLVFFPETFSTFLALTVSGFARRISAAISIGAWLEPSVCCAPKSVTLTGRNWRRRRSLRTSKRILFCLLLFSKTSFEFWETLTKTHRNLLACSLAFDFHLSFHQFRREIRFTRRFPKFTFFADSNCFDSARNQFANFSSSLKVLCSVFASTYSRTEAYLHGDLRTGFENLVSKQVCKRKKQQVRLAVALCFGVVSFGKLFTSVN